MGHDVSVSNFQKTRKGLDVMHIRSSQTLNLLGATIAVDQPESPLC
jgi:hypothetical protein